MDETTNNTGHLLSYMYILLNASRITTDKGFYITYKLQRDSMQGGGMTSKLTGIIGIAL